MSSRWYPSACNCPAIGPDPLGRAEGRLAR